MTYVVTWQLLVLLSILSVKHTILLTLHELLASICFPYLLKSLFSSPTAFRQLAAHSLLTGMSLESEGHDAARTIHKFLEVHVYSGWNHEIGKKGLPT